MIAAALDVGGANIKAARSDGVACSRPFALWKEPGRLVEPLEEMLERLRPFDRLAVTMTGELCDCFASRSKGVRHILGAVIAAARRTAAETPLDVWQLDGRLVGVGAALEQPRNAAAANWLALASWAASIFEDGEGLIVDSGSTTTDLIPVLDGRPAPAERTDTGRLRSGELVYTGVSRTPVSALLREVRYRGELCRVAAEMFATTLDAYLVTGEVAPDPSDHDTADSREATPEEAVARLARVVCADPEDFTYRDARELADQVIAAQLESLRAALRQVADRAPGSLRSAVIAGSGEFLARRLVDAEGIRSVTALSGLLGRDASDAACAWALARLASDQKD